MKILLIFVLSYEHLRKSCCFGAQILGVLVTSVSTDLNAALKILKVLCASPVVSSFAVIFIVQFRKRRTGVVKHRYNSVYKTTIQVLVPIEASNICFRSFDLLLK